MIVLLLLTFLLTLSPLFGTQISFNFQPAKNNLSLFPIEELEKILPNIRGVKSFSCSKEGCFVKLYPLLVSYTLKGFSPLTKPKLERYLGLKTYYRYSEDTLAAAADNIVFFLRNNGYLDVTVRTVLKVDKRGYAKLIIIGSEGNLYLWGGFSFNGTKCFSPTTFYRRYQKPFGIPFSYLNLYNAIDLAWKLCREKGYLDSFVYYVEPFEVKRKPLSHFLWINFKNNPLSVIDFLSHYLDLFIENPFKGIAFLFHPLETVYPTIQIYTAGIPLKIEVAADRTDIEKEVDKFVKEYLRKKGFLSVVALQNAIIDFLERKGFFDVKVDIFTEKNLLKVKIFTGKRYRLKVLIRPPLKDFKLEAPPFYSYDFVEEIPDRLKKFLQKEGYLYKAIKLHKEVDRRKKEVVLTVFVEGLRKVNPSVRREIEVTNSYLRNYIKAILKRESTYKLLQSREERNLLRRKLLSILKNFGCAHPEADIEVLERKGVVGLIERVSCGGILKFGKTAFWVEGRIKKRELEYLIPSFEGKRFNKKLIDMLRNRLSLSNLFESFTVKGVRNKKIIPLVEGVERKPLSIGGEIGYSSDEGLLLNTNLRITDPFGFGSRFTFEYKLSSKRRLYHLSYLDDYFFSKYLFVGGNLFKRYEEHRDYSVTFKGGSATLGYHLNLYTDVALTFLIDNYDMDSSLPQPPRGTLKKVTLSGEIYYPLYGGPVKRGLFEAYTGVSAGKWYASYWKITLGGTLSLTFGRFYGSFRGKLGAVSSKAPVFEKFYLGGIKDLKGFSYESVAPTGGGDLAWYFGTEWGIPLTKPLYLFAGFDVGNSVKRGQNPLHRAKKDIFVGVGSITAAGPLRFVIALPLEGKVNFQSIKYLFLVGFNF